MRRPLSRVGASPHPDCPAAQLPSSLVVRLGLTWRQRGRALLADGRESVFDIYEATVNWDGEARRIHVDEAETAPLVGMSLLEGYELTLQAKPGGNVTIRAVSHERSGEAHG